ncbi:hypothetical protein [Methylomagnum sp.]
MSKGKITRLEARKYLAELVYPDEMRGSSKDKEKVNNRIRNRVERAKKKGEISDSDMADVSFCKWVISEYKIDRQPWMTEIRTRVSASCVMPISYSPKLPDDPIEVENNYIDMFFEIESLKGKIAELEKENAEQKEMLKNRRKWAADAGKQGGRGREK